MTPSSPKLKNEPAVPTDDLLRFLQDPASHPGRPRRVRLIQTHGSWVFLTPRRVLKVKKPVDFGFMDFSTLEKRRHFCEREVDLNRRLSRDVYLGVVAITFDGDGLAFDGEGSVVEYAVRMRRLSTAGFLDKLVERDAVGRREINRIASVLAKFYRAQHPTREIEEWGRIKRLKISTDENFKQTRPFVGKSISRAGFEAIRDWTNRFYDEHKTLFASRVRDKRIRDCHGDLHLEHVHLSEDAINIYDCIEFNDRFRYVDVANDVAFLAMDLDFRGRFDLAAHLVDRMATLLKDDDLPRLMDFYKCYRACVRGKVESLRGASSDASEAVRRESMEHAARYFRLALRYAVAGSAPMVLAVMGRVATGKSTLAEALADELGWRVVSSDRTRKHLAGVPRGKRVGAGARERLYSAAMTDKTYRRLFQDAERLARSQGGAIVDATFSDPEQRRRLIDRLERRGIAVRFIEATASDRAVRARLRQRDTRSGTESDARLEDFEKLAERHQPPVELSGDGLISAATAGPLDKTLARVLRALTR